MISLLVAELLVPFLQFYFIRKPMEQKIRKDGKKPFSFLDMLQGGYNRLLAGCFAHSWLTLGVGVVSVVVGIYMMGLLPQRLLPAAERSTLAMRYGSGTSVGTVWEGDYDIPVMLKSIRSDSATVGNVRDELLPVGGGVASVPLRSVAKVEPSWEDGQVVRRNGVRTITVMAETERGVNAMEATAKVQKLMEENPVADGVRLTYGGELEENEDYMPQIMGVLVISVAIIFFILVFHFKCVMMATLMLVCLSLCLFGTATGVLIQGVDFGVTCTLGIVSLMGILVRNGIIMIDYAEELRRNEHMNVHDAIYHSAQRRMRPIFLTSAAASMGVIPMKLGGSGLWMPMGTLIFYGTLITMFFILTVIPVAYWKVLAGSTGRRANSELIEQQ